MNPVTHFEMAYGDRERMAKFYRDVFSWKTQMLGEEMGHYVVAQTDETDEQGMLKKTNRINGGFYPKRPEAEMNTPSFVIAVGNLEEAMAKIKASGGKVLGEPVDIPGVGRFVSFLDTEENRASILQPLNPM